MKKGLLIICILSVLFSSCGLFYSRVKKDNAGDYVTQKGKRYTYYRIDKDRGYIIDETGKKIILSTPKAGPIKNPK
jgi:hypothetical protein